MSQLTLYHFPKSSCSRKVLLVMLHKSIAYEEVIINLEQGQQKSLDFLRLNPHGQVPVLQYRDHIIYDSAVINEFLEEKFPEPPLLPQDEVERAKVRMSTVYADQVFYPHISRILRELRKPVEQRNQVWIETELDKFQNHALLFLERSLQKQANPFLFGALTLADVAYAPGLDTLLRTSKLKLEAYPTTREWLQTMTQLPAFRKILSLVGIK
jgi:maleylacetoacetate isomerase